MSKPSDLVQGTLDLLLLKILALEPLHGWAMGYQPAVKTGLRASATGERRITLPGAAQLEQDGWITAEWKTTESNRRAKFYSLTRLGRKQLARESANWDRLSTAITNVIRLEEV